MARDKGLVTSSLTFDIKGYFDFVNHKRLLNVLREKRVPLPMVQWVASFLQDREASICLDGKLSSCKPVHNGVPQGSPVSGILSAFYSTGLIEFMQGRRAAREELMQEDNPSSVAPTLFLYVDDGRITVHSDSLELNTEELRYSFTLVRQWFNGAGLQPDLGSFLSSYHHLVRGSLPLEHSVLFHSPYQSPRGSRCSIWTSPGEAWPHCSPAWWPGTWWPVTACPASTSTTPRLWPPAGPCPTLWQHSPPLQGPKVPF